MKKPKKEMLDRASVLLMEARTIANGSLKKGGRDRIAMRKLPQIVKRIRTLLKRAHARPQAIKSNVLELRLLGNFWLRRGKDLLDKTIGYEDEYMQHQLLIGVFLGATVKMVRECLKRGRAKPREIGSSEKQLRELRQKELRNGVR